MQQWLKPSDAGRLYGLDIETLGLTPTLPNAAIVGIGLANEDGCFYTDLRGTSDAVRRYIRQWMLSVQFVPFNALFEGIWLQWWLGQYPQLVGDSYGLFKQMSLDGFRQQSWSLETAELGVLGWPSSNKEVLAQALKQYGLTKATMSLLPPEILGPYCALDAEASWQLWEVLCQQTQSWTTTSACS